MRPPLSRTFFDLLAEQAASRPTAPAVIDDERTITYAELHTGARKVAHILMQRGIGRGDRIGLLATNCIEWLEIAFGASALGAVVVPFSTWVKPAELDYLLSDSRVKILFSVASFGKQNFIEMLRELLGSTIGEPGSRLPDLAHVIVIGEGVGDWQGYYDLVKTASEADRPAPGFGASATDDVFVLYTSGSTARPKAVRVVHYAAIENGFNIGERQRLTIDDRVLLSPPLFWIYACGNALVATLTHGATLVLQSQFDAEAAIDLIERHRCTSIYTLPVMTAALIRASNFSSARTASLRTGLTIGSAADVEAAATTLGASQICNVYGATEIYGNCCVTPSEWPLEQRKGCQGPPLPGVTVRIVDQVTRAVLPAGEIGEAEVTGYRTPGYAGASAVHNDKVFTEDGYFRTGDLGLLDENGYFHFVSRSSEIIKRAGINVSPAEIEESLQRYDGVAEVGVVGAPDAEKGEIIVAFVVPKANAKVNPEDVRQYCRTQLSSYKVPDRVEICASLPATETGKLARRQLKELAKKTLVETGAQLPNG